MILVAQCHVRAALGCLDHLSSLCANSSVTDAEASTQNLLESTVELLRQYLLRWYLLDYRLITVD